MPQIFPQRKTNHFHNLVDIAQLDFTEFLLFDDDAASIKLCQKLGVSGCLVSKSRGLNWSSLLEGLHVYQTNERTRKAVRLWMSTQREARKDSADTNTTMASESTACEDDEEEW